MIPDWPRCANPKHPNIQPRSAKMCPVLPVLWYLVRTKRDPENCLSIFAFHCRAAQKPILQRQKKGSSQYRPPGQESLHYRKVYHRWYVYVSSQAFNILYIIIMLYYFTILCIHPRSLPHTFYLYLVYTIYIYMYIVCIPSHKSYLRYIILHLCSCRMLMQLESKSDRDEER